MRKKGYIYTVLSLLFALVLLGVLSLYYEMHRNTANVAPEKLRTDELHYFLESSKKDIRRAMTISSGRAAVYMIDYVVNSGAPLSDPQQNLKELMLNGTVTVGASTTNITYMQNHTLNTWLAQVQRVGDKMSFDVSYNFSSLEIYTFDSWHFLSILTLKANISDKKGMCWYEDDEMKVYALTGIYGLEDALYPLKTTNKVKRYFAVSEETEPSTTIALGSRGNGIGGGIVYDISKETSPNNNISQYNTTYPRLVNYTVFIMDLTDYDSEMSQRSKTILNLSAGVINYFDLDLDDKGFPYISNIPSETAFSNVTYVVIRNSVEHQVLWLSINRDIADKLYYTSVNGSSFFDRLEGNLNASDKYKNQSRYARSLFNLGQETDIGLEGFVNVTEFSKYGLYPSELYSFRALPAFTNQSSLDYLYFQNVSGRWVYGSPEWFRLDALHLNKYNLTEFRHDPNLSGAWYLNEGIGLIAYGSSRISEDADLLGAMWITGRLGNALFFDGINDYVEINDPRARLDMNQSVTLSAWINATTDVLDPHTIIARLDGSKWPYNLAVSQSTGAIKFDYTFNGGSPNIVSLTGPAVNDAKWHHVAATRDDEAGTAELYVDGELVDSESYTGTVDAAAAGNTWIGRSPGGADPFSGAIDEVKIWNRALSKEEVKEEYERGWKTY